ncbi:MAG: hypothetical protein RLZZ293_383 [Pseudomonadota bacterium]|jgi:hypothetical protein
MNKNKILSLTLTLLFTKAFAFIQEIPAVIHFYNNTQVPIYYTADYDSGSNHCKGKMTGVKKLEPNEDYEFKVKEADDYSGSRCSIILKGYTSSDLSTDSIAVDEHFHLQNRSTMEKNGDYYTKIISHDTPPRICGVGMSCSTNLHDENRILDVYTTDKNVVNQYVHLYVSNENNDSNNLYVNFDHISGYCTDSLDNSWFKLSPQSIKIDYITTTQTYPGVCQYRVSLAKKSDGSDLICKQDINIEYFPSNIHITSSKGTCMSILPNSRDGFFNYEDYIVPENNHQI